MRTWRLALLAWNGLRRTPLRFSLAALGVVIAAGALVSMVAFALGVQERAEAPFKALGLLDVIQVSPKKEATAADPVLDDDALKRIAALPGVASASPDFRVRGIKITHGDKTESVIALGLPTEMPLFGAAQEVLVAGSFFHPDDANQVILAKRLVSDLGFRSPEDSIGATVTLEASGLMGSAGASPPPPATDGAAKTPPLPPAAKGSAPSSPLASAGEGSGVRAGADSPRPKEKKPPNFAFQRKKFTVTVVGVYDIPELMAGPMAKAVGLPLDLIRQIPGVELEQTLDLLRAGKDASRAGYRRITVRVTRHSDLMPVDDAIRAMGFDSRTLLGQLDEMRTFFVFIDVLLAAVGTIALLVSGLGILNTLLMCVLERQQEIGIYKAIGASDRDLVVLFLTEAGLIGVAGGLGGLLLGRCVSWLLEIVINAYAHAHGVTTHLAVFSFPLWLLIATVLFSSLISILAGVYPALRAARIDPIVSLRRE